jgi:hypothetical protein
VKRNMKHSKDCNKGARVTSCGFIIFLFSFLFFSLFFLLFFMKNEKSAPCKMKGKLKNARGGRIKEEKINKISPSIFLTIFFNQKKREKDGITEKEKILESHHFIFFQNHNWIKSWYGNTRQFHKFFS